LNLSIKNEIVLFAGNWMELEIMMLREVLQYHKGKFHVFLSYMELRGEKHMKVKGGQL
jgi:hypothetical protein